MSKVKDFLNPNSMLTPGIAGSITMMIANALWVNFALPPKYTALVLCLLLGLVVLAELRAPLWQKSVYYIINVLIIFSVSAGSNVVGISTNQITHAAGQQVAVALSLQDISHFFINSAKADNNRIKRAKLSPKKQSPVTSNQSATTKKPNIVQSSPPPSSVKLRGKTTSRSTLSNQQKERTFFRDWF